VVFERDAQAVWFHAHPGDEQNDYAILIVFLVPESGGDKIINKVLDLYLKPHMIERGFQEGSLVVNDNLQVIIVSDAPLDGQARNQLIDFNLLLKRGIRHFTTDELQFDPTNHIMQPQKVEKATEEEVDRFVEQQKGFMIGNTRLAKNLEERIEEAKTDDEVEELNDEAKKEIIDKLPTINSSDPLVKWNGFRTNDILKIWRRIGQSEFTFRRVIFNGSSI
jgi:DNA-directed RNA polymerase subunit H (RpoH/RPB5)